LGNIDLEGKETSDELAEKDISAKGETAGQKLTEVEADAGMKTDLVETVLEAEVEAEAQPDPAALAEEYYNRLIRLQADFENFRRRARQEKENLWKYAAEHLVVALLPVLDNFERALEAGGESVEDFKAGIEMIYRQFQDVLRAEGLSPIPAVGEQFDPARHEAVIQEESADYPENTVLAELRRGYCLKDKVIRPVLVKIAKKLEITEQEVE
jgi:molecular chaperone GrpE